MENKIVYCEGCKLYNEPLCEEVGKIINKSNFEVELYGVNPLSKKLPKNYRIENYEIGELLAVCENGNVVTDYLELQHIEDLESAEISIHDAILCNDTYNDFINENKELCERLGTYTIKMLFRKEINK